MSYQKFPVDGKSNSQPIKLADPVEVLIARSQLRAWLVARGDHDLIESADVLQEAAKHTDLLWLVGQDCVQSILASAFETFCPLPPTTSEVCVTAPQTSPKPASDKANPADDYAGLTHSFARACRAADAAHAQRTRVAAKSTFRVAESTLQAAEYLLQLGDRERWRAWLAEHSPDERIAIRQHLKRAKAKCPA